MAATMPASRQRAPSDLPQRKGGFTLVELALTLVLASILASIAVPSMSAMLATQRSNSAVNALFSVLNLARNEAIKRNGRAVLCKSTDGASCIHSGGWEQGWILFQDANNNTLRDPDETIIQSQSAASNLTVRGNAPIARYVSYSASGTAKLTSGAFQAGTFTICQANGQGEDVRQVVLSATGRVRVQKGSAGDCP
ncbi:MAG: GspH/FimT family pseudopilin [Burkholderiaceae bacterium]